MTKFPAFNILLLTYISYIRLSYTSGYNTLLARSPSQFYLSSSRLRDKSGGIFAPVRVTVGVHKQGVGYGYPLCFGLSLRLFSSHEKEKKMRKRFFTFYNFKTHFKLSSLISGLMLLIIMCFFNYMGIFKYILSIFKIENVTLDYFLCGFAALSTKLGIKGYVEVLVHNTFFYIEGLKSNLDDLHMKNEDLMSEPFPGPLRPGVKPPAVGGSNSISDRLFYNPMDRSNLLNTPSPKPSNSAVGGQPSQNTVQSNQNTVPVPRNQIVQRNQIPVQPNQNPVPAPRNQIVQRNPIPVQPKYIPVQRNPIPVQ
jgi:hypothetical protein